MLLGYCASFDLLHKIVESHRFKCIDVCGLAHWVKNSRLALSARLDNTYGEINYIFIFSFVILFLILNYSPYRTQRV